MLTITLIKVKNNNYQEQFSYRSWYNSVLHTVPEPFPRRRGADQQREDLECRVWGRYPLHSCSKCRGTSRGYPVPQPDPNWRGRTHSGCSTGLSLASHLLDPWTPFETLEGGLFLYQTLHSLIVSMYVTLQMLRLISFDGKLLTEQTLHSDCHFLRLSLCTTLIAKS